MLIERAESGCTSGTALRSATRESTLNALTLAREAALHTLALTRELSGLAALPSGSGALWSLPREAALSTLTLTREPALDTLALTRELAGSALRTAGASLPAGTRLSGLRGGAGRRAAWTTLLLPALRTAGAAEATELRTALSTDLGSEEETSLLPERALIAALCAGRRWTEQVADLIRLLVVELDHALAQLPRAAGSALRTTLLIAGGEWLESTTELA